MNILIKNADIVTLDHHNPFIKNADIGIKDGVISFVRQGDGSSASSNCMRQQEPFPCFTPDKIIDAKDKIVMPGLVNAHTHAAMTILRNFADDLPLNDWLFKKILPRENSLTEDDVYWGTMLGIAEMIKSGVTMFADMYYYMDSVAGAVQETKIKANLCKSLYSIGNGEEKYTETVNYYNNWNNKSNGKIKVYIEIHSAYMYKKEWLINTAELAKQLGTGIHTHLLETLWEREEANKLHGMDSVDIYKACGVLDVPVLAAHGVHLTDHDINILHESNVNIVHNPTSNLKLGSGIARIPEILQKGINVALGTDGCASNNNLNMFEEMNISALIHKGNMLDPTVVSAPEALKMATVNGAKALGFDDTGVIKEGRKADIIIIKTDELHYHPRNNPISTLVYSAQAGDVDTVMVDGEILMENRELKTIDEEKVKAKARG